MLASGYFLNQFSTLIDGQSDVFMDGEKIIFSPIDPIFVDENNNVYFSSEKKNAYMYSDSNGKVFVKVVV